MLYPVLHRMEHRGLIKSRWGESETGRKRKYYSLKKDGKDGNDQNIHCVAMYSVPMIRKELVAASTEPLILSLLAEGESYGYAMIQEVKAALRGTKLQWTDGMLYPVLHRMEHRGLIKSRWGESETGRKRKYYSLKKDGKTAMAKHHEQWSLVHSVLAGLKKEQYV